MARWKLMADHYLNCRDTKWEYKEVVQATGRERRKEVDVPRFLSIQDPGDWTNSWGNRDNQQGEIVVCHEGKGETSDITFWGDPTPDMAPVDDEARAISASFAEKWQYKPEGADTSYSQSMIDKFEIEMRNIKEKPATVEVAGLDTLVAAMAALTVQNAEIIKTLSQRRL
jgi:hypothetical protein